MQTHDRPTPETDAFMLHIDDSEIDMTQVAGTLRKLECERDYAREQMNGLAEAMENIANMFTEGDALKLAEYESSGTECFEDRDWCTASAIKPAADVANTALAAFRQIETKQPIPTACEVLNGRQDGATYCGEPTCYAYPAHGGGWMPLCHDHGQKHLPQIKHITTLILEGERLAVVPHGTKA